MSKQNRNDCRMHGRLKHGGSFHNWIVFTGADGHVVTFDLAKGEHAFGDAVEPLHTGVRYNYELLSDKNGNDGNDWSFCTFRQRIIDDGRTLECEDCWENEPNDYQDLVVYLDPGYGTWVITGNNTGYVDIPDVCPDGGSPPLPPPTVDPIPPGANDGKGNCGWDGCVPTGTVMGGGDFKDTMELVGSDGHKVTYTRINNLEETPIGSSIPGLHPGIVYEYTLKSDCGVSNDGQVNADCEIDHRISMDGRRLEMEDMMLEGTQNYTDLILTLDEGVGTFAKSSETRGTLTMADTCAADEAEGEGEGEEDPNISCSTSTILSTGYTDPEFFTHAFDPGMIRSVKVINPHDPNGRFLRITIDPHVCDIDSIIDTLCLCTSYDAYGDPIVEFGETTVTKVDDYTIDVVIVGWIIETHGYVG